MKIQTRLRLASRDYGRAREDLTVRQLSSKREGWGLSGGRMEFPNKPSITVKNLTMDEEGRVLLVHERYMETKPVSGEKTLEEALMDMENLIARLQSKGSDITWAQVGQVLDEGIPKIQRIFDFRKWFSGNYEGERKLNPGLVQDWDPNSETVKILLTAIREELEETGLLIWPEVVSEFPSPDRMHKLVVCRTLKVEAGRLKRESQEIKETEWVSPENFRMSDKEAEENKEDVERATTMYHSHKFFYLPRAFQVLLERGVQFPNRDEIQTFIESCKRFNPAL
ncbi:MAG: hypothetical protein Q8P76_02370 [bacterium]|nr:hypothetical protein [bacterium]